MILFMLKLKIMRKAKFFFIVLYILFFNIFVFSEIEYPIDILCKFPKIIKIRGDKAYITCYDKVKIYVYSLKNRKIEMSFLKKGEGPSEAKYSPSRNGFKIFKDYYSVSVSGKIMYFDKKGGLIKSKRHHPKYYGLLPVGNNFVCEQGGMPDPKNADAKIIKRKIVLLGNNFIFGSKLKKKKDLIEYETSFLQRYDFKHEKFELNMIQEYAGYTVFGEKIYCGKSYEDRGEFHVFDSDGKLIRKFKIEFKKRKIKGRYKKESLLFKTEWLKSLNKKPNPIIKDVIYLKYYPSFRNFFISDDKIYMLEYPYDKYIRINIADIYGKVSESKRIYKKNPYRFMLEMGDGYYIYDNALYYLSDTEEGWVLKKMEF